MSDLLVRNNPTNLFFGISLDVLAIQMTSVFNMVKGPAIVFLVSVFLSDAEIGVWYTFVSLAAMISIADLGFSNVIMHFVARVTGSSTYVVGQLYTGFLGKERELYLIQYLLKIFIGALLSISCIVMCVGVAILDVQGGVFWCWILLSMSGGGLVVVTTVQSVLMGLGSVSGVYFEKMIGGMSGLLATVIFLYFGYGIWALSIGSTVLVLVMASTGLYRHQEVLKNFIGSYPSDLKADLAPLLKLNLSNGGYWVFLILGFQCVVPLTYRLFGAEAAGQVGIWMAILLAIQNFSNSIILAKLPRYTKSITLSGRCEVLLVMRGDIARKVILQLICVAGFMVVVFNVEIFSDLFRMERPVGFVVLSIYFLLFGFCQSWAACFRAFQKELFLAHSCCSFISVVFSFLLGPLFFSGIEIVFVLMLFFQLLLFLPWCLYLVAVEKKGLT